MLQGADLNVEAGHVVAILGPSGSGKTTLLHLLAGLDTPTSGEVWWGDFAVHAHAPRTLARQRAERVGLVFQDPHLLPELKALDNVSLPGRIRGRVDRERAAALLEAVGLAGRGDADPRVLSGGERQRVAVARALYADPPILLADEPTGSLDRATARTVFEMLVTLARSQGRAVVMVTHDEGLVQDVDGRYFLESGILKARISPT